MYASRRTWCGALVLSLLVAAALTGCERSLWESQFASSGATGAALPADAPVQIREVPWERVQETLKDLNAEAAASDVHPDDWPQAKKDASKARLLKGLQVSGNPGGIGVLGRSDFRTTSPVRADDGALAAFARKIGADSVVVTRSFVGKADVVRTESINEFRTGSWYEPRRSGRRGSTTFTETSTTFVPVHTREDQWAWIAFFLRIAGGNR
jgi:hypothetical protein